MRSSLRTGTSVRRSCVLPLAGILAAGALRTHAQVPAPIVYEGYDYNEGAYIGGLDGGTGWTTNWVAGGYADKNNIRSTAAQVFTNALNQVLPTIGRGHEIGRSFRTAVRVFPERYTNGVYWLSFLMKPTAQATPETDNSIGMRLQDGSNTRLNVANLNPTTDNLYGLSIQSGTSLSDVSGADGTSHFFVVRYAIGTTTTDGAVHLFIDPDDLSLEPEVGIADAARTGLNSTLMAFDRISPREGVTSSGPANRYDELRLGTSYYAVTATERAVEKTTVLLLQ